MRLMVTGGAGFIGSNFIRYWLEKYSEDYLLNYDLLTYAGNTESLIDVQEKYDLHYQLIQGDINDLNKVMEVCNKFNPDLIVNFAAESHNSYAVVNPSIFFKTNVMGTQSLLEAVRKMNINHFHHISTCEVYGDLPLDSDDSFTEQSPYCPRTPYNASKASSDMLVRAYHLTYGIKTTISNCANNYGPYQFPEKLIPLFVTNLLENKEIPLYQSSSHQREWIHVNDHCRAIDLIINKGKSGETYNVGTGVEKSVEQISDIILERLNCPPSYKKYVQDRPGHDRRYLLDSSKIRSELEWKPEISFQDGMEETIDWYVQNQWWWKKVKHKSLVTELNWNSSG
ncbi:MAG: dTDP-glucose 4,6-dehydratase [Desulfuromonas sp. SDB]|nr:MAG: dTDP-glucose 4,6-dehydratase [Desulfuromonas sp. SDB]